MSGATIVLNKDVVIYSSFYLCSCGKHKPTVCLLWARSKYLTCWKWIGEHQKDCSRRPKISKIVNEVVFSAPPPSISSLRLLSLPICWLSVCFDSLSGPLTTSQLHWKLTGSLSDFKYYRSHFGGK